MPPSRGNFYEGGVTKGLFGKMRLDVSVYRRQIEDFADDDVLLNTGVTFPIAFRQADIRGSEVKLSLPMWKRFSRISELRQHDRRSAFSPCTAACCWVRR